jgi:lysozyme family protein
VAIFRISYDLTNQIEGGYVNDPDDKGGETYRGIARKKHPSWRGWYKVDDVKKQTSDVKSINA